MLRWSSRWRCSNCRTRFWKSRQLNCTYSFVSLCRYLLVFTMICDTEVFIFLILPVYYLSVFRNIKLLGYALCINKKGVCYFASIFFNRGVLISEWPSATAQKMLQGQMVFVCTFLNPHGSAGGSDSCFKISSFSPFSNAFNATQECVGVFFSFPLCERG